MALKDWKKVVDGKTELEFKNKKTNKIIRFEKTRSQNLKYNIWIYYINNKEQVNYFKTKKYAKDYMRKH